MNDTTRTQVVVIGAGFSGLAAAQDLVDHGINVLVLEARDRVGGRTLNVTLPDGKAIEMGGQWVGPGQDVIIELARELGIATYPTYDTGRKILWHRGRARSYRGSIPPAGPVSLADLGQALLRLQRMAKTVDPREPWQAPRAQEWDRQSLGTWMLRNTRTRYARTMLTLWSHSVMAADPDEMSLLHVLTHAAAHRGLIALMSTRGGAQEERIVGGSQGLVQAMADRLGDRVMLNRPVRRVHHTEVAHDGAGQVWAETDTLRIEADRLIVATSPVMAGRLDYSPPLPAGRDLLTQRMGMGSIAKVVTVYPNPFWRDDQLSGQTTSDTGLLACTFDNTPQGSDLGALVGFIAGSNARAFAHMDPAERRRRVLDSMVRLFGPAAADPIDYHEKIWIEDEWARGGYFGIMPPGGWTAVGPHLRKPIGPIHWAGSETAETTFGSMDGAIRAGRRAAKEARSALRSLTETVR
ncbi:flavin monoamine oxidase family protein [Actinomadura fulvescens]|uniref:Flavin monoamine oxidase family protein n=1 Tax=Actinomadura fulvescens TaxID=46160 RepID=A0ABP6CQ50_9ACTN